MTNAVETARAALEALEAATPDYCSPDRAAHDAKVDAAWKAFVAAKDAEKHAAKIAKAYRAEVRPHAFGTQVRVGGRWHLVPRSVELVSRGVARNTATGAQTYLDTDGKRIIVVRVSRDGYVTRQRTSSRNSAMKYLTSLL